MKFLIVDDNQYDRKLLRLTLEHHGCDTVLEAGNGEEALEVAHADKPDIIISDALMPRMDGFQLLRMVKLDPALSGTPFIFYSAVYTGYKEEELALSLGAETFIVKPKEPEELWHCISAVLEKLAQGKQPSQHTELMEEENAFLRRYDEIVTAKLEEKVTELQNALAQLTATQEELSKANEELETRVAQRTRELEISRAQLALQNSELVKIYNNLKTETAERLQAMKELREKDQLLIQQCRMAAMGEILSNIAHHWRQPLNIVGLKLQELAMADQVTKDELDANVADALKTVFALSKSIDDFRMLSEADDRKIWFDVNAIVAKAVSFVEGSIKDHQIEIEVTSTGPLQYNGHPHELGQVILNILMNARDTFRERGTASPRISVRSWTDDGKIILTITDNAGGIDEEILGKIFDPYFSTRAHGKGSGVGLFISKRLVETQMGGRLTARSAEGGAEFRIEL